MNGGEKMCNVVSIINMKGGVGKTTLTINLAYYLAYLENQKVLIIDFDPQSNSSSAYITYNRYEELLDERKVISEIFTDIDRIIGPVSSRNPKLLTLSDLSVNVRSTKDKGKIDIVVSELELSKVLERSGGAAIEERLAKILEEKKKAYDYVLIDCSPTYSVLTNNALMASDYILIPVKPDPFSARGIPMLLKKIEQHNRLHNDKKVEVLGIVFNLIKDDLKYMDSVKAQIMATYPNVFQTEISVCEHYSKGLMENKTIYETSAQYWFKDEFTAFAKEFIEKIEKR
jgi:chromosome partitioning protein